MIDRNPSPDSERSRLRLYKRTSIILYPEDRKAITRLMRRERLSSVSQALIWAVHRVLKEGR